MVFIKVKTYPRICVCVCVCVHGVLGCMEFVIVMLVSNQIFELEQHKEEWVEVIMGVAVGC